MFKLIGKSLGRYLIQEAIGQGGMASVYRATDQSNGDTVAIKVMLQVLSLNDQFRVRFRREAEVLQRLQHENIVPVLDYGEFEDVPYIVMPFMSVGTLSDRLASGPLKPLEGAQVFSQIASALHFAHENGVVHRDVKPSNILLDDHGNALLSDFGFAHIHDASLNLTGSALIGTPAYMSPEQIKGEPITAKADQYALGVILYEISTGALPYDGDTPMAVAIKHATDPLPAPSTKNPNLPIEVEKVILRALEKDPSHRFDTVATFNQVFQDAMHASIDFQAGRMKPEAFQPERTTLVLESAEMRMTLDDKPKKRWGLVPLLAILMFILGCPVAYWGYTLFNAPLAAAGADPGGELSFVQEEPTKSDPGETEVAAQQQESSPTSVMTQENDTGGNDPFATSQTPTESNQLPTSTLSPSSTQEGSATPTTFTQTPSLTPSRTSTSLPTNTSTTTPTSTPTQTPTATPTPSITIPTVILVPTKTPITVITIAPIDCDTIRLGGFSYNSRHVSWDLANLGGKPITLTEFWLDWPAANDELKKLILNGDTIWEGEDEHPPTRIAGGWKGSPSERTLGPGEVGVLRVEFDRTVQPTGYFLELRFSNGCMVKTDVQ